MSKRDMIRLLLIYVSAALDLGKQKRDNSQQLPRPSSIKRGGA
jgi:hypothetical protein